MTFQCLAGLRLFKSIKSLFPLPLVAPLVEKGGFKANESISYEPAMCVDPLQSLLPCGCHTLANPLVPHVCDPRPPFSPLPIAIPTQMENVSDKVEG